MEPPSNNERQQHHRVVSMFLSALRGNSNGGSDAASQRQQEGFQSGDDDAAAAAAAIATAATAPCSGGSPGSPISLYAPAGYQVFSESDPVTGSLRPAPGLGPAAGPGSATGLVAPMHHIPPPPTHKLPAGRGDAAPAASASASGMTKNMYLSLHAKLDRLTASVHSMEAAAVQATRDLLWYVLIGMFTLFVADQFLFRGGCSDPAPPSFVPVSPLTPSSSSSYSTSIFGKYER